MRARAHSQPSSTVTTTIVGERDITRVGTCRAIWKCDCGYTNRLFFNQSLILGSIYGRKMSCGGCNGVYRGMFVTDPFGRH
jgi:hypothetical protein